MAPDMVTIFHLSESRSERLIWLMEELGEPYELCQFNRLPTMEAPPEYRALHPMGTSPMIRDGEDVLIESGAIVEHLMGRYGGGRLQPAPNSPDRVRYVQWLHFAEGMAMSGLMNEALLLMAGGENAASPVTAMLRSRNDRMMRYIDGELEHRPFFAGADFTAADLMMTFIFPVYRRFLQRPLTPYPHIVRYVNRIEARPAYIKAMALANPGAEHW
jgi:glutathione S-transferase